MKNPYELLTPSQKKLLEDQEQWMEDAGKKFTKEWSREDAIYAIMDRFPSEQDAQKSIDSGGYPAVVYLYTRGKVKKTYRVKKSVIPKKRCKCK